MATITCTSWVGANLVLEGVPSIACCPTTYRGERKGREMKMRRRKRMMRYQLSWPEEEENDKISDDQFIYSHCTYVCLLLYHVHGMHVHVKSSWVVFDPDAFLL